MKLSALPIILIGLAVGVVVASWAFFHKYRLNSEQAKFNNDQAQLLEDEAAKMPTARKRVQDAENLVREKEAAWNEVVATRTLPGRSPVGIDLNQNDWQLAIEVRRFRNSAQRALNAQLKRGGVTVVNGPSIPMPEPNSTAVLSNYFNYPAVSFPVLIWDLGAVTIRGTYKQISDHVRAWSRMPNYLAVTDGLQITGTSPMLTATYNLSLVGYIEVDALYPALPEGGAPAGGGGAPGPGGPGGSPFGSGAGGPPGGPPGGFPGGRGGPGGGPPVGPQGGPPGAPIPSR